MNDTPKPIRTVRQSNIAAAIWKNATNTGEVHYGVTFERLYKTNGQWRSSQTFGRSDLLLLAKVANEAHTVVGELYQADKPPPQGNRPLAREAATGNSARGRGR
ncbi:MAG TPA: hypothetical protein VFF65_12080 [Phycisphaerales bacterium]|nr:hypothetical protein [Phycisphaerales bacterium]